MAAVNATAVQAKVTAAGIDWQKIKDLIANMNWMELIAFIRTIISLFKGKPPVMAAGAGCGPEDVECARAHFEAITELSTCGANCLPKAA